MRAAFLSPTLVCVCAAVGGVSTGCTSAVAGGQPGVDAETTVTHAVVLVERTADAADGTRAAASARFARAAAGASSGDTLRAIGANLELPARGSCANIRPGDSLGTTADPVPFVELLNVGRVSLDVAGSSTSLVPRQLPYVTDVVTGTVYAKAAEAALFPASAQYRVHATGTPDVPAFDISAIAPAEPTDVVIAQETSPGSVTALGPTVDFSWPRASADLLYVEVQPAPSALAVPAIRCVLGEDGVSAAAAADDGLAHASIPASLLDDAGSLVLHRVHSEPLQLRGVDDGELRFDFARVVGYVRQ
jgi:hypothetical protein